ncbi:hypothetical protein A8990_109121 [Paenibacillus taihuensis]|uniref:Uncharacterized protein n=1 Tax=Paenibacillus taihuensis TaxID=1156355 RepID=A0A3D9S3V7_9BACL|nr:hypothetical protein [Paenibacillus taihuensis]REE87475.1 hypothetical protein A8990_109121 [Paenibacillus taihuensis]
MLRVRRNIGVTSLGLAIVVMVASGCTVQSTGTGNGSGKQMHGKVDLNLDTDQLKKDLTKLNQPVGEIIIKRNK